MSQDYFTEEQRLWLMHGNPWSCMKCKGTGRRDSKPCFYCKGEGGEFHLYDLWLKDNDKTSMS